MSALFETGFETGRIIDLILLLVVAEAVILWLFHRRTGRGIAALPLIANLAAGGALMLALRAALTEQGWPWIGAFLTLSLIAHLIDVGTRIQFRKASSQAALRSRVG